MNNPSPLQGGTRRRQRRPGQTLAVVVLLVAATVVGVVLANSDGENGGSASAGRAPDVTSPARAANPNRALRGKLPLQSPPGISLPATNAVAVRLHPKPAAALLFDVDTGRVLWSLHPLRVLPIASVTKMMTALLAVERLPRDSSALIKKEAVRYTGSMLGVLPRGRRVAVRTLLYGALLPSGNDAAVALADRVAGTDRNFAQLMNERARQLGLTCTHYVSAYGLEEGNRSCAVDLAALARVVLRQPQLANIVRHRRASLPFPYLRGKHLQVYSTNPLLRLGYPGTIGLKTGFTDPAGHCLVAIVHRGTHTLGAVLLNSVNTGAQGIQLMDAGFKALAGA